MGIFRFKIFSLYFATSILVPSSVLCDETGLNPEIRKSLGKFGMTIVLGSADMISKSGKSSVETPDATLLGKDLVTLTDSYRSQVYAATFGASLIKANGELIITSTQVLASSSGVGALPAGAIAAVARYGNDKFASYIASEGTNRALGVLSAGLQSMNSKDTKQFDQYLNGKDYEKAANFFDSRTNKLSKMQSILKDDPAAADTARRFLIENLKNGTSAAIIQSGKAFAAAQNVEKDLANHVKVTNQFAKNTKLKLTELEDKSKELKDSVEQVANDINSLFHDNAATAYQIGLVQDMLFDQQSPKVKLALLEAGAQPGLNSNQRDKLTNYLQVEVRKQEILATASMVVSVASDVNVIMENFGVKDKNISEAVHYGSVANSALSQVFSGNYLGAIATVSGLFGGAKEDPVQKQFQLVFAELGEIKQKLDTVIDLQKKTLLAIEQLSQQMVAMEKGFHERLDLIDFELKVINAATLQSLWGDYGHCMVAWEKRTNKSFDFDDTNLKFNSLEGLVNYTNNWSGDSFQCASKLRQMFSHLRNSADFGNPIRLEFVSSLIPEAPPAGQERTYIKRDLQTFLDQTYKPAAELVIQSWQARANKAGWGSIAGVFSMLSTPADTSTELIKRISKLDSLPSATPLMACKNNSLLGIRLKTLLCADSSEFDLQKHGGNEAQAINRTAVFLKQPIIRDQVAHIVNWAGLVANSADFAPGGSATASPLTIDELSKLPDSAVSYGRDILYGALMVTDIAIAQQVLVYGDLTAYFIFEQLWDSQQKRFKETKTDMQKWARSLLSNPNNPWLQRNVVMLILQSSERDCQNKPCNASDLKYRLGIDLFYETDNSQANNSALLKPTAEKKQMAKEWLLAMFDLPQDVIFEEIENSPSGIPIPRRVVMKLDNLSLQMPTVSDWKNKLLDYPPGMIERMKERNTLAQHWADYAVFDEIPQNGKLRLIHVFSKGVQ